MEILDSGHGYCGDTTTTRTRGDEDVEEEEEEEEKEEEQEEREEEEEKHYSNSGRISKSFCKKKVLCFGQLSPCLNGLGALIYIYQSIDQ